MIDDGYVTKTSKEQLAVERDVASLYSDIWNRLASDPNDTSLLNLNRSEHARFIRGALGELPGGFSSLDASRPWIAYWATHALNLLDVPHNKSVTPAALTSFLSSCKAETGGFAGGPYQIPHLAPTYAAICALVSIGTPEALEAIDVCNIKRFLEAMCVSPSNGGGMTVHEGGEADIRSCYMAIAVAHILNLDKAALAKQCGLVDYVQRCQTYEGGLGGEPGNEAHGGYTYCGLAALCLLGREQELDLPRLMSWAVQRQSWLEGGFNGRTNKLADGCYSFWQGGLFSLLQTTTINPDDAGELNADTLLNNFVGLADVPELPEDLLQAGSLQDYVLEVHAEQAYPADDHADASSMNNLAEHAELVRLSASRAADDSGNDSTLFRLSDALPVAEVYDGKISWSESSPHSLYSSLGLQLWILGACQAEMGLRDKPGKNPDYYHSCYCLSGLSSSQHNGARVLGGRANLLKAADPRLNIVYDKIDTARAHFATNM